jgi:hypothetical protein
VKFIELCDIQGIESGYCSLNPPIKANSKDSTSKRMRFSKGADEGKLSNFPEKSSGFVQLCSFQIQAYDEMDIKLSFYPE